MAPEYWEWISDERVLTIHTHNMDEQACVLVFGSSCTRRHPTLGVGLGLWGTLSFVMPQVKDERSNKRTGGI